MPVCLPRQMAARPFAVAPVMRAAAPARSSLQVRAAAPMVLRIKLKGYEVQRLDTAIAQIQKAIDATGALCGGVVPLPTRRRIYCVLRSPHVNKDSREHFEIRTHSRLIHVKNVTREAVDALMGIKLPAGVDCNVKI